MLVPARTIKAIDFTRHEPTADAHPWSEPALLKPGVILQEEELILCTTNKDDKVWYLAEVHKIYPDEIEVIYYTPLVSS